MRRALCIGYTRCRIAAESSPHAVQVETRRRPASISLTRHAHVQAGESLRRLWRQARSRFPSSLGPSLLPQSLQGPLSRKIRERPCAHEEVVRLLCSRNGVGAGRCSAGPSSHGLKGPSFGGLDVDQELERRSFIDSSKSLASTRSGVSNPSSNHPYSGASKSRPCRALPCSPQSLVRLAAVRSSQTLAPCWRATSSDLRYAASASLSALTPPRKSEISPWSPSSRAS